MTETAPLNIAAHLDGWLPARVEWREGEPFFDWCYLGDKQLTEPFFDHTIEFCLRYPFNLLFRPLTPLSVLREHSERNPGLTPAGFIFHLSRCGSTLISRMLAASPANVVISEASPIDWMIRARARRPRVTDEERIAWLRWTVSALGQRRNPSSRRLFIKFDAWHTRDISLLERAFPGTPWIFLYRDPLEVMVSHYLQPGAQTVPGMIDLQWEEIALPDALKMSREEYTARILAEVCRAALQHAGNPNGLFVNYTQLPGFATDTLPAHFRLDLAPQELAQMNETARYNAKAPSLTFQSDTQEKRRQATEDMRQHYEQFLLPLYQQLENTRHKQNLGL